jgi:hypothetical protein
MSLRKYADIEHVEVLSPEEQERIERGLHRLGKRSVRDLDEDERRQVLDPKQN